MSFRAYRNNPDEDARNLERKLAQSSDVALRTQQLVSKIRSGQIQNLERIRLAARLGHPVALGAFPVAKAERITKLRQLIELIRSPEALDLITIPTYLKYLRVIWNRIVTVEYPFLDHLALEVEAVPFDVEWPEALAASLPKLQYVVSNWINACLLELETDEEASQEWNYLAQSAVHLYQVVDLLFVKSGYFTLASSFTNLELTASGTQRKKAVAWLRLTLAELILEDEMIKSGQTRRNPDEGQRSLERLASTGDLEAQAKLVRYQIRTGELDVWQVKLASWAGHPIARLVYPNLTLPENAWHPSDKLLEDLGPPPPILAHANIKQLAQIYQRLTNYIREYRFRELFKELIPKILLALSRNISSQEAVVQRAAKILEHHLAHNPEVVRTGILAGPEIDNIVADLRRRLLSEPRPDDRLYNILNFYYVSFAQLTSEGNGITSSLVYFYQNSISEDGDDRNAIRNSIDTITEVLMTPRTKALDADSRRNPDDSLRQRHRESQSFGDPVSQAKSLQARLRTGQISTQILKLAAILGHPAASQLYPTVKEYRIIDALAMTREDLPDAPLLARAAITQTVRNLEALLANSQEKLEKDLERYILGSLHLAKKHLSGQSPSLRELADFRSRYEVNQDILEVWVCKILLIMLPHNHILDYYNECLWHLTDLWMYALGLDLTSFEDRKSVEIRLGLEYADILLNLNSGVDL